MTEWNYLLASIAATTADYREGNLRRRGCWVHRNMSEEYFCLILIVSLP